MFKLIVALHLIAATAANPMWDGRIVGGKEVNIDDFPYQLSLQYHEVHLCGASILSEKYALTAAHCTDGFSISSCTVVAGISKLTDSGQRLKVARFNQHPDYNDRTYDNDISVLEMMDSFKFNARVKPIALSDEGVEPEAGDDTVVSGWGLLSTEGEEPDHLHAVHVKIVSREDCRAGYGQSRITSNMICAQLEGKDSCTGDSGGALVNKKHKQIGIVSWGIRCAEWKYPGIYTNVATTRSYIKTITGI